MTRTEFINEAELLSVPLPIKTESYTPIPNRKIIDLVNEECYKQGLTIVSSEYKSSKEGKAVIGQFNIQSNPASDLGMRVVFKNSYDKSMSFGLAMGAQAWICSNGVVSGEIVLKRKHTGTADEEAKDKIITGIQMLEEHYRNIVMARKQLQECVIDTKLNAELVGRMFMENEIITSSQLNIIKQECENSKHFTTIYEPGYSAWDLYMNTSHALKMSHPMTFMQDHIKLHDFMTEQFC